MRIRNVDVDDSVMTSDGGGGQAEAVRPQTTEPHAVAAGGQSQHGTPLVTGHRLRWWRELVAVGALYVIYESTRNLSKSGASVAYQHALDIIRWQKDLRINVEYEVQRFFLDDRWIIILANYFYGAGYMISTLFTLVWLYRRRPDHYPFWRNVLAISTLIGLIGFRYFPLMPPRLLDVHLGQSVYGFVDTLKQFPTLWSFNDSAMEKVSNQYAAMPSLHCAWAIWVAMATVGLVRTRVMKVLVVLLPVATIFTVVVTANHYLLDAVAGLFIMLVGFGVALLITRAGYVPLRGYRMKRSAREGTPAAMAT